MDNRPIGVFDSGIGGLTVLRSLRATLPEEKFVYLGDTARTPYGTKDADTIRRYSLECAAFLADRDVKAIVVACNTSSAHALGDLETRFPLPVIGTVSSASKKALAASLTKKIGVIGTQATIESAIYEKTLLSLESKSIVTSASCPLFVPLVEQGMFDGDIVEKVVALHLQPLKDASVDTLILGCTHYPLLSSAIQTFLPDTQLIACSDAVASELQDMLPKESRNTERNGVPGETTQYFVTDGVTRFERIASILMGTTGLAATQITFP